MSGSRLEEAPVALRTWIAVGGSLLGAFMAVLDIMIANSSLPYIEGGIGTGGVFGTWISTAYLIRCSRYGGICSPMSRCS